VARKRILNADEDVTSQAGWLFADSFLALMIIFLATISFVPSTYGGGGGEILGTGRIGNIAGTNYVDGLVLAYEVVDPIRINQDIAGYIKEKELAPNTRVFYAKIIGGYSENDSDLVGTTRAIEFAINLRKAGVSYFDNAKIDIGSSKLIPEKTIVLRLTLSPNGE
jgi:hypothetical protein